MPPDGNGLTCGPVTSKCRGIGARSAETINATIDMKAQPESSTQEVLAGLVERVTYHNAENGFCVLRAKARGHRDVVTVIGHAASIAPGEWITASGEWINDRTHGHQFKARFLRTSPPTSADGIEKYLSSGMIRGVGPVTRRSSCVPSARRYSTSSRRRRTGCARLTASDRSRCQHSRRLQRNLLYTGVTRDKRLVVLVGQKKAVAIAVRNVSGRRRWSKLGEWLASNNLSAPSHPPKP